MFADIVSKKFETKDSNLLDVAKNLGAYSSIDRAFEMSPEAIVEEVDKSGLRGKGGGGGSTGHKWKLMPKAGSQRVYLCVNSDESEPGTFKDRYILAKDPHLLIEGVIITCYALGANDAYMYIRGEYTYQYYIMQKAINEAYEKGILGENACGKGYRVDFTLHRGAGAYICGEKTAQLVSIEGFRGNPRLKPHSPEPDYLFGSPCVVNNVETIATVPYIINNGAKGYRKFGTDCSPGSLLFGVSGHINNPIVKEAEFGTPMMKYIDEVAGGVWKGRELKAVIPGGSSCKVLTRDEAYSVNLDYESMRSVGTSLGTGGMIVMDETTDMVKALLNLLEFYKEESCGQCTPCREGTGWALKTIKRIDEGRGTMKDIDTLLDISGYMNGKTICVFAPAVSDVIDGFVKKFIDEFVKKIKRA